MEAHMLDPLEQMFILRPLSDASLLARTGKSYKSAEATVAAKSCTEARQFAKEQDHLGLAWNDPQMFECKSVDWVGGLPEQGRVIFHCTD
jgi:hypothetical protein